MQKKEERNFYNEVDFGKQGTFLETNISYIVKKRRKWVWAYLQVIEKMNSDTNDRD